MVYLPVLTPDLDLGTAFKSVPWLAKTPAAARDWLRKALCDSSGAHALHLSHSLMQI